MKTLYREIIDHWFGSESSHRQIHDQNNSQDTIQEQNKSGNEHVMCNIFMWMFQN